MAQKEFEMPEEYKLNLAALNECLEAREDFRAQIKAAEARGTQGPPEMKVILEKTFREFDQKIEQMEMLLAEEYERYQAEQAKEAKISEKAKDMMETMKELFVVMKHKQPELVESFTKDVIAPMPDDLREEFLDGVAILESTKLDAILKGEE